MAVLSGGRIQKCNLPGHLARIWTAAFGCINDARMRTTVTLDADVARMRQDAMHRSRKTLQEALRYFILSSIPCWQAQGSEANQTLHRPAASPGASRCALVVARRIRCRSFRVVRDCR